MPVEGIEPPSSVYKTFLVNGTPCNLINNTYIRLTDLDTQEKLMGERHNNPGRARREYAAYLASTTPEQRRAEAERERYEYSLTTARNDAYRACSAADRDAYERVKDAMQRAETHAQCVWAAEKRKQAQKDTQQ